LVVLLLTCAPVFSACNSSRDNAQTNSAPAASSPSPAAGQAGSSASKGKLNLNTASESEFLAGVPGLGSKMAHEFEEYRPYRSIQQFRREMAKYVSADQIAEYEKYVFVPIAINEADAATLQQLPGIEPFEAEAIIAGRPYASEAAFMAKVTPFLAEGNVTVAKNYLSK
ncbi:MAG TPA: helix-hairpin-helix domain-containing protein, partial [Blastocatellia bacterium]|nr:helix-hairpin-helix domain-containing protein [Blastocatellia bacterium]